MKKRLTQTKEGVEGNSTVFDIKFLDEFGAENEIYY